jgi:hypothetical protein
MTPTWAVVTTEAIAVSRGAAIESAERDKEDPWTTLVS